MNKIIVPVLGVIIGVGLTLVAVNVVPTNNHDEQDSLNTYEDAYLSFAYPDDLSLLFNQSGEGRVMSWINWIGSRDDESFYRTLGMFNPEIKYPYHLLDNDYSSWEELKTDKLSYQDDLLANVVEERIINGQEAVYLDMGGFCAHHHELFIQGPEDVVYQFMGGCMSESLWSEILETFSESVEFKQ